MEILRARWFSPLRTRPCVVGGLPIIHDQPPKNGCSAEEGGVLNRESASFCKAHSLRCAGAIGSCFFKLDGEIRTQEGNRTILASRANSKINAHRELLNNNLQNIVAQVKLFNAGLKQSYPFLSPLQLNEGQLSIAPKLPEMDSSLMVPIIEGGDPTKIQQEFERLIADNIRPALAQQRTAITAKIREEIANKAQAYQDAQKRWQDLATQCATIAKEFAEAQRQHQEQMQDAINSREAICNMTIQANAQNCKQESLNTLDETFTKVEQTFGSTAEDVQGISDFKAQCHGINYLEELREDRDNDQNNSSNINSDVTRLCKLDEIDAHHANNGSQSPSPPEDQETETETEAPEEAGGEEEEAAAAQRKHPHGNRPLPQQE